MASRIVPEGGHRLKPFKTPRERRTAHLSFIGRLPCICCLVQGSYWQAGKCDPAHIRASSLLHGKEHTGRSEKPSDWWAVPLCRPHHEKQHGMNELNFWKLFNIDPFLLALVLWGLSGKEHQAIEVLQIHARTGPGR